MDPGGEAVISTSLTRVRCSPTKRVSPLRRPSPNKRVSRSSPAVSTSSTDQITTLDATNQSHASSSSLSSTHAALVESQKTLFLTLVQQSKEAVRRGNYPHAVKLYSDAINLDPCNHILYSNRSAAYIKSGQYKKAVNDAAKAREINSQWTKAYYRQGLALKCLGQQADSLSAFAAGLAQDPKDTQLLSSFVDTALKSVLKDRLCPIYDQLEQMRLEKSPFVIISVVGQELLSAEFYHASVSVLESALKIGTCSLKLRGSVFSALGSAHWGVGALDKAIAYMHQDLNVAKSLGDQEGECRAYVNLGAAYFSKGNYKQSLHNHRYQLVLAMKLKQKPTAATALSSLGHVYTAIGDYPNALASHKQCVLLLKQNQQRLLEAREIGNVGAVYLAMGDFDSAVECHNEHLKLARSLNDKREEARAVSNLGSAHHYKRSFEQAIKYHNQVLDISVELKDRTLEARAYAGLGHASRCLQDYPQAKFYHEKQLDNSLQTRDKVAEGRACSNLGIIYQHLGEFDVALKLHKAHMGLARDLLDKASLGRAYGNIGNAHSAIGQFDVAIKYHKMELAISKEVNDRHSEASTHGNLAVAYQALKVYDKALHHYQVHLTIAQELKDTCSEAQALNNLGNYHSSRNEYPMCIPYYEQYLILSQELQNVVDEGCACHKLGFAHYSLGNIREAIRYYEQDLAIAKDLQDRSALGRAYCNLGLAHKANGDFHDALECQKYFLAISHSLKNLPGKFRALGNIGDVHLKMNNAVEALKLYNQQFAVAEQSKDRGLKATAFGALGVGYRLLGQLDKALGYHSQELNLRQEMDDARGECRAHGNLGTVHMALCNFNNAFKCYNEQLERAKDLMDATIEAQACGNLAITKMNLSLYEDAIGYFEQQLALLEQCCAASALADKGKALGNLGDCYEALGDFYEAIRCYEHFLAVSLSTNNVAGQERAYRGMGTSHRAMGNLQQALVCFEKRVVVAHESDDGQAKGSAYGELGCLHSMLGNYEQAISCLEHQLEMARENGDSAGESDAACGLGGVYQQMGEYNQALKHHQLDLHLAEKHNNAVWQCRAYGNMGLSYESLGNHQQAIHYQEQHLSIAAQMSDRVAKTLAYSSLGRVHHTIGNYQQAVQYLHQGLNIAEQLQRKEDEAKIRHRLGLALLANQDLEQAQVHLYKAADLFEMIRREAQLNSDYKLSLFDLQTASYQALQRVLVSTGRHEEALVVAERGRTRAFVDLLLERQGGADRRHFPGLLDQAPVTIEEILTTVSHQTAAVLYYSVAAGYLYTWLITPDQGIVKFHETSVVDLDSNSEPEDNQSIGSVHSLSSISILDQYVGHVRESLGVDRVIKPRDHVTRSSARYSLSGRMSETESEADDLWQQHLNEIGERLNSDSDRSGFLRMVNRNHAFNSSNYSLTSLFSNDSALSAVNRTTSAKPLKSQAPLCALYNLLIGPMEQQLSELCSAGHRELVLVLQGDLYLIPFSVLRASQGGQCLYERFNLVVAPSLQSIHAAKQKRSPPSSALVVGNPKLVSSVIDQWQWYNLPAADHEARLIAEMLGTKALIGPLATKDVVMRTMPDAEVIHFATHISWKLSAIVLASEQELNSPNENLQFAPYDLNASEQSLDGPALSDFLLTAADILNLRLSCKLVVLSSGHSEDRAARINADGVVGLTRALLAAGAQCVLFSLWPVPEQASRLLLKSFYTSLLQGCATSRALSEAMVLAQSCNQNSHPANWAGWVLVGSDVKLSSNVALMGSAFCELVQQYPDSKESMRLLLHLVEKSLQRLARGQRNSMYTTQASIENKMIETSTAWKDLLKSIGFRFEPAAANLPPAVFFPTNDPGDRLTQCSASLQALLGLSTSSVTALSKMITNNDAGDTIINVLRDVMSRFQRGPTQETRLGVRLWRSPGCHEFLASLGFDLVDVGRDDVTLKLSKLANRKILQFGLTALLAVFDTQEAPHSLSLASYSSMESLNSSHTSGSATSTSNFSKGSSPPGSPRFKKRSIFNPADVARPSAFTRTRNSNHSQQSASRRSGSRQPKTNPSLQLAHLSAIRAKYGSDSHSDSHSDDHVFVDSADSASSSNEHSARTRDRYFPADVCTERSVCYSTSSEGEDVRVTPMTRHASRQSTISTHSTVTLKSSSHSVGDTAPSTPARAPAIAFRRNHTRASVTSTMSSASERTLTNEPTPFNNDPTKIALRVLAETFPERQALERIQRDSVRHLAARDQPIDAAPVSNKLLSTPGAYRNVTHCNLTPIQERFLSETGELGDVKNRGAQFSDEETVLARSSPRPHVLASHDTPKQRLVSNPETGPDKRHVKFLVGSARTDLETEQKSRPVLLPKPIRTQEHPYVNTYNVNASSEHAAFTTCHNQYGGVSTFVSASAPAFESERPKRQARNYDHRHHLGSDGTDTRTDTSTDGSVGNKCESPRADARHKHFDSAPSSELSDDACAQPIELRTLPQYKPSLLNIPNGPPPVYQHLMSDARPTKDKFLTSKC